MPGLKLLDRLLSAIAIKTSTGSSRVLLSIGRGVFLEAVRLVYERVRSLLSDLSYFPNLALTLMSACMRGARVRARQCRR